jgi:hypothetical protein
VLDGVLSDRSNSTCQIGVLFIRIDSMSFRGSAGQSPIFFILNINGAFDLFENVSVMLEYAGDLKLFKTIKCQLFQMDLDHLDEWCNSNKFDLNADKCKSISFRRICDPLSSFI